MALEGNAGVRYIHAVRTTRQGLPFHTVVTKERDLAFSILAESFEVDNDPNFAASRGTWVIEFYGDSTEAEKVLASAEGRCFRA